MPPWAADYAKDLVKNSPTLAVCLAVVWFAVNRITAEHKSHLESKDKEIERLVDEKRELQSQFVKNLKSSVRGKQS